MLIFVYNILKEKGKWKHLFDLPFKYSNCGVHTLTQKGKTPRARSKYVVITAYLFNTTDVC